MKIKFSKKEGNKEGNLQKLRKPFSLLSFRFVRESDVE
jgi:hypothetical protein